MDLNPETYRPYRMYTPRSSRGSRSFSFGWTVYPILLLIFILVQQGIAHSISQNGAEHAAEALGYTNVKVTGSHTFFPNFQGCGEGDMVKFDVTGLDPKGVKRKFFVCDGLFKGATVRFN